MFILLKMKSDNILGHYKFITIQVSQNSKEI